MSEKEQPSSDNIAEESAGELLKKTRESQNLTRNDVMAQLNLHIDTIVALEENNHEKLPVSTYVRGYLRNYARLLKLDPEDLLTRYENNASAPPEILPNVNKHSQTSSQDKPVKAFTYLVTFVMALLLLAWLQSQFVVNDQPATSVVEDTSQSDAEGSNSMTIVEHPDTPYFNNRTDEGDGYPPLYDSDPGLSDNVIRTMELPNSLSFEDSATGLQPTANNSDSSSAPSTDAAIVLNVREDSWIEIRDAKEKRLYIGLAPSGDNIRINGLAPFSLLLGNASGVDVTFKGEIVDTKPFSNAGVARFNLGGSNLQ